MDYKVVAILALTMVFTRSQPLSSPEFPHSWLPDTSTWTSACPCARIYQPQCASDGRTYNNLCEFQCRYAAVLRRFKQELFVVRSGRCDPYESYELEQGVDEGLPNYGADGNHYGRMVKD